MHDVFPKARFRDCIEMTRKEGRVKLLRDMRAEWINATRSSRQDLSNEMSVIDVDEEDEAETRDDTRSVREENPAKDVSSDVDEDERVKNGPAKDDALFVTDMSDIDMDEILGSQRYSADKDLSNSAANGTAKKAEVDDVIDLDDFEDEMEVLDSLPDF
jgi:Replication Fork Protection Component Swi3